MKISKSFKIYIHIIVLSLLSQNLIGAEDFSKNVIIHEKPQIISELRFKDSNLQDVDLINKRQDHDNKFLGYVVCTVSKRNALFGKTRH